MIYRLYTAARRPTLLPMIPGWVQPDNPHQRTNIHNKIMVL